MNKQSIVENTGSFHKLLIESLKDQRKAAAYLQVALDEYQEEGDLEVFLLALRNVVEAKGGITLLAKRVHLKRQSLYHTLSGKGNPRLSTLGSLFKGLGFHLLVESNLSSL